MSGLFDFTDYGALLRLVHDSLVAAALLGVVGGSGRRVRADAGHAVRGARRSASCPSPGPRRPCCSASTWRWARSLGSLVAGALIGVLGVRARDRNSVIGVLMPFGLGLGVLFLSLYQGRAANKFGLLTGQIVAVDTVQLGWLVGRRSSSWWGWRSSGDR